MKTIGQARRTSADGNMRYHKLENLEAISRKGGSFWYAISNKSLITYHRENPQRRKVHKHPDSKNYKMQRISFWFYGSGIPQN